MGIGILVLIGFGSGIILFPIGLWFYKLFKNTFERLRIKKMLRAGQFLVTIDTRDYDYKAWQNQRYGNINIEETKKDLEKLNEKIFKKSIESSDDNFFIRVNDYIKEARKIGYTDEQIREEFRKKSYTEDLINKIFEQLNQIRS
jgi:hypothetical protein